MEKPNGGSVIGGAGPTGVDVLTGELISEDRGMWNDYTQSWEKIVLSRAQKTNDLVQQRRRSADFSREYEHYVAANSSRDIPGRLHSGVHDPEDDPRDGPRSTVGG